MASSQAAWTKHLVCARPGRGVAGHLNNGRTADVTVKQAVVMCTWDAWEGFFGDGEP